MSRSFLLKFIFVLSSIILLSCQKESSFDSTPVLLPSILETRSASGIKTDNLSRFDVSEALVRQYVEENEKSAVIRSIEPYEIDGEVLFYVVNLDRGWQIISADARTKAVLAKGESGRFDITARNNANVRFWLRDMAEQISAVKHSDITDVDNSWKRLNRFKCQMRVPADTSHRSLPNNSDSVWIVLRWNSDTTVTSFYDVPHLLETKWGQEEPWNMLLAPFSGSVHYVTGCVPTAVAQILYFYHNMIGRPSGLYHSVTVNSISPYYEWISNPVTNAPELIYQGDTTSVSRSDYHIYSSRWDTMPLDSVSAVSNTYGASYVSDLMIDMGNRLNAFYRDESTDVRSMPFTSEVDLSKCNIDYDWSLYSAAIRDSVINNLINDRPVIAMGIGYIGGHAWVIDGGYHKEIVIRDYVTYRHVPYVENIEAVYSNPPLEVVIDWFTSLQDLQWFYPNAPKKRDQVTTVYQEQFFRMNWGENGHYDDAVYSCDVNGSWGPYNMNKSIYYNLLPSDSLILVQ